jgi:hypothetical protein
VEIVKGFHQDHGTAVHFTQGKRRCLLLDTTYGLSDDEALWLTLASCACLQPRRPQPCQVPGQLYDPAEYSHVLEKYWDDDPPDLKNAPGVEEESPFCQEQMNRFSEALAQMIGRNLEVEDEKVSIVEEATISRLRPIQDGIDSWSEGRSSQDTGPGTPGCAPAPG